MAVSDCRGESRVTRADTVESSVLRECLALMQTDDVQQMMVGP
jgi:hypothetical protein